MLDEVYTWLESYGGVSYDFDESIQEIDGNRAFISPFDWRVSIDLILDQLDDAIDLVDEYWRNLPATLPPRKKLKRILAETTLFNLVKNVQSVCNQLNIDPPEISTVDQLRVVVVTLCELIDLLANHELNDIIENNLFEEHEEENDNSFEEILDIHQQDITQLAFNVNAIRQAYYEGLDEDEESY